MTKAIAYILLGSNSGDRHYYITTATKMISKLETTTILQQSSIITTKPLEYIQQPDFLNSVIAIETRLAPQVLLEKLHHIESSLGRVRIIPKGPRTIDCDILLYDDIVCKDELLTLPHPQVYTRPFVAALLLEINSTIIDPVSKKPLCEVALCHQ